MCSYPSIQGIYFSDWWDDPAASQGQAWGLPQQHGRPGASTNNGSSAGAKGNAGAAVGAGADASTNINHANGSNGARTSVNGSGRPSPILTSLRHLWCSTWNSSTSVAGLRLGRQGTWATQVAYGLQQVKVTVEVAAGGTAGEAGTTGSGSTGASRLNDNSGKGGIYRTFMGRLNIQSSGGQRQVVTVRLPVVQ